VPTAEAAQVPLTASPSTPSPRTRTAPSGRPGPPAGTAAHASSTGTTPSGNGDPLAAPLVPVPATWRYAVIAQWRGLVVQGDAVLAWQHDGARYDASLELAAPPLPARAQHSTGALGADGLRPLRFSDRVRTEQATHFDAAQGRIIFSSNRPDVPLQPGAQDRLSVLVQLMALAASNPGRFVPGAVATLQVAGTREADTWRFTVEGLETLAVGTQGVRALKLTRAPQHEYDTRLEVWLAPGQAYAPVRLRLTPPNGDWLDMQWSGTDKG
jgi:hypothetical protein